MNITSEIASYKTSSFEAEFYTVCDHTSRESKRIKDFLAVVRRSDFLNNPLIDERTTVAESEQDNKIFVYLLQ